MGTTNPSTRKGWKLLGMAIGACLAAGLVSLAPSSAASAATPGPLVGIIPDGDGNCPAGSTKYQIKLDDEDVENGNQASGWTGQIWTTANTYINLCGVDGNSFLQVRDFQMNFAVVALGPSCPRGTDIVVRHHDTEDKNDASLAFVPADSMTKIGRDHKNVDMVFCWWHYSGGDAPAARPSDFPDLGVPYGVFGPAGDQFIDTGWFLADDEDSDNRNSLSGALPGLEQWLDVNPGVDSSTKYSVGRVR